MDYYQLLGLTKSSTSTDIKKAYRKLAMATHPDKVKGKEDEFKKITEAYEVLIDEQKRQLYDRYGVDGLSHQLRKTPDITLKLNITLKDLYFGCTKNVSYDRKIKCQQCDGKGTTKNIDMTCKTCKGQGKVVKIIKNGFMMFQTVQDCDDCQGKGDKISKKDACKTCLGEKLMTEKKTISVVIEKGLREEYLTFSGASHILPGMMRGDVIVILIVEPCSNFERVNNDLIIKKTISLLEALSGQNITIEHINGEQLVVSSSMIKPNQIKKLEGYGMPGGDLYIHFNIEYDITDNERKEIIKLLNKNGTITTTSLSLIDCNRLPVEEKEEEAPQCAQQ